MPKLNIMRMNTLFGAKYDSDADWVFVAHEDEDGNILTDEEGFEIGDYVLEGSLPLSPYEEMVMQLLY